ncbi:MAG: diaminopimelate decarboxylase [Atribacterota bacterium]|jgi:diaminopimelate decarboxylase|nr:diaminopimelate decarboxylase [Atribacterota bacterium]
MTDTFVKNELEQRGFDLDQNRELMFEKVRINEIAQKYDTPCYIYSENIIRKNCQEYILSFKNNNVDFEILYAGKAFLVKALCNILDEEGMGIDASSGGEIYTALAANFPAERIYFHGNNKSEKEIRFALENNIGTIMIDNLYELGLVNNIAKELNKKVHIMIRVIPGVDTHTHEKIRTGQVDSKFGFPISELENIFPAVMERDNLVYRGLHCHIGSQLLDVKYHLQAIVEMIHVIKKIEDKYEIKTNNLNLGGGLGVRYTRDDNPVPINIFVNSIINKVKDVCDEYKVSLPKILIEPGRSIVAEAGITLYRIGAIKEITGLKKYLIVDGGMADNPRPSLYDAKYEALIVDRLESNKTELVTIAGKFCESGDILIKNIELPRAESGDLIILFTTGAYHYSMANNYNGIPRPPVVLVNEGKHGLMVNRETYQDVINNHVIPDWLM